MVGHLDNRGGDAVDQTRLWSRLMDMARIGATPKGGVNRQALSPEDAEARRLLGNWAEARGFSVFGDAIGNLFVRRPGSDPGVLQFWVVSDNLLKGAAWNAVQIAEELKLLTLPRAGEHRRARA